LVIKTTDELDEREFNLIVCILNSVIAWSKEAVEELRFFRLGGAGRESFCYDDGCLHHEWTNRSQRDLLVELGVQSLNHDVWYAGDAAQSDGL